MRPGENWNFEIDRALSRADFVLVFISENSVDRRGYVQRELKKALDRSTEKLLDDIFLIPIVLDADVDVPRQLEHIQHISATRSDCHSQVKEAIDRQLFKLGAARRAVESEHGLTWNVTTRKESWEGLPGFEVSIQFIDVKSNQHAGLNDVGDYIKGQLLQALLAHRATRFEQSPAAFNYAQSPVLRTNTFDAICGSPTLVGDVLTIPYDIGWYGAGAAHSHWDFRIFNFYLNPVALVPEFASLFQHDLEALATIQTVARTHLCALKDERGALLLEADWVNDGTQEWKHFTRYGFAKEGIRVFFPPYQVGAYACGSHVLTVPYREVVKLLQPELVAALGISHVLNEAGR